MRRTRPTQVGDLVALTLVAGVVSWLAVLEWYGGLPRLRWFVPLSLGLLATAEAISGFQLRARIRRRPGLRPVEPLMVARQLALAKASALVGAGTVGVWAGMLAYLVPRLRFLSAARGDAITAGLGVLCGGLLTGAALWLEYSCRTPKPPEDRTGPDGATA
ncbi:MAG: DUF3180 domain-containing protein [Actinobacteria bacterium]|nr:DUF3180 domain-containing protein [Actinomycetota bacterium]